MYNVRSGVATKYIPRFINSSKSKLLCSIPSLSLGLLGGLRSGNTGSNSLNRVGNDRSHSGEKKDFLDVGAVGEEHDKTVDTKTPATCRWETVLETTQKISNNTDLDKKMENLRIEESLVNTLGFLVTLLLLSDLLHESLSLIEGVVQLSVGIANLLST